MSEAAAVGAASDRLAPGLYLLATPIGAARDITLRGLDALGSADVLACEDSRVLRRLMDLHGVAVGDRPIIPYHDHNADTARPKILAALSGGGSVVYASDAGTPLISDPGHRLVADARAAEIPVVALPGPSAVLAALAVAGLPTDRFTFLGFPPPKSTARRRFLEPWRDCPSTLVLFEAPHRLAASLTDMAAVLGEARDAAIARELTKRFEEVRRGALGALSVDLADAQVKGELVVVIGPPEPKAGATDADIDALLTDRLAVESLKDAVRTVTEHLSESRKRVYARALKITGGR